MAANGCHSALRLPPTAASFVLLAVACVGSNPAGATLDAAPTEAVPTQTIVIEAELVRGSPELREQHRPPRSSPEWVESTDGAAAWADADGRSITDAYIKGVKLGELPEDRDEQTPPEQSSASSATVRRGYSPAGDAALRIETLEVAPAEQRSLVVSFHLQVARAAPGEELHALFACAGRGGWTSGGALELEYKLNIDSAVEYAQIRNCSYPDKAICACMKAVVMGWKLPPRVGSGEVAMRVQVSKGSLPPR